MWQVNLCTKTRYRRKSLVVFEFMVCECWYYEVLIVALHFTANTEEVKMRGSQLIIKSSATYYPSTQLHFPHWLIYWRSHCEINVNPWVCVGMWVEASMCKLIWLCVWLSASSMSDIDEPDFTESQKQDSGSFRYSTEPLGTPPSVPKSSTINHAQDNLERKHRRSVSEQIFSVPNFHAIAAKGHIRGRHRKRNTLDKNGDGNGDRDTDMGSLGERYSGGSLGGYNTGWDYGNHSVAGAYMSDFSPFERNYENSNNQPSSSGRSCGGTHFKQALKRTVKRALNSSRTVGLSPLPTS